MEKLGVSDARSVSTKDLAKAMGVTPRSVQGWQRLGCPCDKGIRPGRGRNTLWFSVDEVRAWQAAQGLDSTRGALFDPGAKASDDATKADGRAKKGSRGRTLSDEQIRGFDTLVAAKREIVSLIDQLADVATAPEVVSKLTKAIADLNKEERLNEERNRQREEHLRLVMKRAAAARAHEALATMYRTSSQTIAVDFPAVCIAAMIEAGIHIDAAQGEAAQRVLGVRLRAAIDERLAMLATAVEKTARELGLADVRLSAEHAGATAADADSDGTGGAGVGGAAVGGSVVGGAVVGGAVVGGAAA